MAERSLQIECRTTDKSKFETIALPALPIAIHDRLARLFRDGYIGNGGRIRDRQR
jgi:hypothetical protein